MFDKSGNGLLDRDEVNESTLLRLLDDRAKGPVEEADTGHLDFGTAHAVTAPFIVMPAYGTRCSTVVLADASGQWRMTEKRFDAEGESTGDSRISFAADAPGSLVD